MMCVMLVVAWRRAFWAETKHRPQILFLVVVGNQLSVNKDRMECEETWEDVLIHSQQRQESWKVLGEKQLLHHLLSTKTLGGLWTDAECGWSFYNNNNKRPRVLWLVKSLRNGCCVISGAWKKPLGSQSIRCEHTSSVMWNQKRINYTSWQCTSDWGYLLFHPVATRTGAGEMGGSHSNCRVGIDYNIHHFGHAERQQRASPLVCAWYRTRHTRAWNGPAQPAQPASSRGGLQRMRKD
jgi:hypothetical protein